MRTHVVETPDRVTLYDFIRGNAAEVATSYTDEPPGHSGLSDAFNRYEHHAVRHSVGAYVRK